MKNIEVSDSVYERLAKKIIDFSDTPNSVIERLLNSAEDKVSKPNLCFYPVDEVKFKKLLLRDKKAEVALYKNSGEIEVLVWNASKLKDTSNIKANIWSGYLRNWEEKGIRKAEFSIYERPVDANRNTEFFLLCERLSPLINIPYKVLIELEFEQTIEELDGHEMLILQFYDGQNLDLLEHSPFFNSSMKRIEAYQHEIGYPLS